MTISITTIVSMESLWASVGVAGSMAITISWLSLSRPLTISVSNVIRRCKIVGYNHIHGQPGTHGQKQLHIHDHSHILAQHQQTSCHNHDHIHHIHIHHSVHEDPEDSCVCSCCLHRHGELHRHSHSQAQQRQGWQGSQQQIQS